MVEIQQQVSELPSYGYRRVWGLLRRARETQLLTAVNVRVYRVMHDHNLLLERRNSPACRVCTKALLRWKPAIRVGAQMDLMIQSLTPLGGSHEA